MPEHEVYECPDCGADVTTGMSSCPECGTALEWDDEGEETIDDVLEAVMDYSEHEGPPDVYVEEPPEPPEEPLEEPPEVPPLEEEPPGEGPRTRGGLSTVGLVFTVLAVLAAILTLVAANYDVWVQGAEEEAIGTTQRTAIYLGVAGLVVCLLVVVWDWWRNRA